MMKRTVLLAAVLLASASFGQANGAKNASLASARAKITQVIDNPSEMTEVMKSLSAEDQKAFLAEVNAAIEKMPGNDAERTAKYVAVIDAALAGAQKDNALTLVAEVFATVPPIALTAVNESLGAGLMNRAADKDVTYTDEQYIKIAQTVMEKVNERVAGEDNSGVRSGFAALMLIRGSNSTSNDAIYDAIVEAMPENSRNDAKVDWFPAALGRGREKSYEPMLAVADVEYIAPINEEDYDVQHMLSLRVSASEQTVGLLSDIAGGSSGSDGSSGSMTDAMQNPVEHSMPTLGVGGASEETATIIGRVGSDIEEVRGYQYQTTR